MPHAKPDVAGAAPPAVEAPPRRNIPFGRPIIDAEARQAVLAVLAQPTLTHGPQTRRFEEAFAAFTAAPHAAAVSSCTAALHLAYLFLEIGPGDEVIVPALTHVGTAHAVELCGARCVFVDAEPRTGNLDLDQLEAAVTDRTRAVSVVHFLGIPADMARVVAIARRHGLPVVEDCALALGAALDGRHVGLHGDAGCFSFYPVKHVTTAEGGMLITHRDDLAADAARRRAFGIDRNVVAERPVPGEYDVTHLGHNYRLNEIAAAIGLAQMRRLAEFLAARRANHAALSAALADLDEVRVLDGPGGRFASACYCLGLVLEGRLGPRRRDVMAGLKARGVGTSVYYPRPVPHLSYYRGRYGIADNSYPVARRLSARSIALPVGPHLEPQDLPYIIASVKDTIAAVR
jgi:dTDP-4-amino-4,6-dideoxygalactose transaminase